MIDLSAELVAALRSEAVGEALEKRIRAAVAQEVRAALDERDRERMLDVRGLAERWSCTVAAAKQRIGRSPALAQLAIPMGRRRMWRVSDVDRVLDEQRADRLRVAWLPAREGGER